MIAIDPVLTRKEVVVVDDDADDCGRRVSCGRLTIVRDMRTWEGLALTELALWRNSK